MRGRAFRRHKAYSKMMRRLKEDRNEHYDDLTCACWHDPKAMARFKEQPQVCSGRCCGNQRKHEGPTMQERRWLCVSKSVESDPQTVLCLTGDLL